MYKCSNCGYRSPKWMGRCPDCEEWESFVEDLKIKKGAKAKLVNSHDVTLTPLNKLETLVHERVESGIGEFDRVLGGGMTVGSVVLIGGEPGIGKSTLLIEAASCFAEKEKVLYISAEESLSQVSMRAKRLGIANENLLFAAEDSIESILPLFERDDIALVVIDSIQVVGFEAISAAKGSVAQVRESAHALTQKAKQTNTSLVIVGHVTKEGGISGPKLLEHIVDAVIYFEGEKNSHYRILRAVKNRFGSIGEIGVFEMSSKGLVEVNNPSAVFVSEQSKALPGRSIGCVLEGVRPMLIEAQGLTANAEFRNPCRRASGYAANKLTLIAAMLEKRLELNLSQTDIFINVTGGMRVYDPCADLAIVAAVLSAYQNINIPTDTVFLGEVGLLGELRSSTHLIARLTEIQRLGFKRVFVSKLNYDKIDKTEINLDLVPVANVSELLELL